MSKSCEQNCRLGKVGGEAVIEGVMMRCGDRYSLASRLADGSIAVTDRSYTSLRKKNKIFNLPLIRGMVSMVESLKLSFGVLALSAEALGEDLDEPETKFEKWLCRAFGDKLFSVIMSVAGFFGILLAFGLFIVLPSYATKGIFALAGWDSETLRVVYSLFEGIIRIGLFLGYILLVSQMKDIRRTFEYHGAEHKSIACYEAGVELTPENAKKYSRFHPRCGTSFLFVMLLLSILVSICIPITDPVWLRLLIKLPLIPMICGLGFEFILFAGKHDNALTRTLSAPGLWMQRITTREPDLSQLEIAITALKASMPEEFDRAELDAFIESTKPQTPSEAAPTEDTPEDTQKDTPTADDAE